MVSSRKQKIVGFAVGGIGIAAVIAILVYALATGSPFFGWMLLFLVGFIVSYLPTRFATRSLRRPRKSLTGRLMQGYILVAIAVLGFGAYVVLPYLLIDEPLAFGFFAKGTGWGVGVVAFFRLVRPTSWRTRSE